MNHFDQCSSCSNFVYQTSNRSVWNAINNTIVGKSCRQIGRWTSVKIEILRELVECRIIESANLPEMRLNILLETMIRCFPSDPFKVRWMKDIGRHINLKGGRKIVTELIRSRQEFHLLIWGGMRRHKMNEGWKYTVIFWRFRKS